MLDESEPEPNSSQSDAPADSSEQETQATKQEENVEILPPQGGEPLAEADNLTTPKPISQKKMEANKRNAQFSPGPRTPQGKRMASRNAVKWALTTNFLITQGPRREDPEEFEHILTGLREYYQPVGLPEEVKVHELGMSYIKTQRASRAEKGEISRACAEYTKRHPLAAMEESFLALESRDALLKESKGLEFLLLRAELARQNVHDFGAIGAELRQHLSRGRHWNGTDQHALLRQLDKEITELKERMAALEKSGECDLEVNLDASAIPGKFAVDKILRYENSNLRHRQQTERSLAELQAQRRARQRAAPPASKKGGRSD